MGRLAFTTSLIRLRDRSNKLAHNLRRREPMPPNIPTYNTGPAPAISCWQCRHFATSWDPALPYQCKLLGFKSRMLPSMQVQQIDGRPCQGFEPKQASTAARVSGNRQ